MPVIETFMFCGTDFNPDHRGELISELYHAASAADPDSTTVFSGAGSVGTLTKEGPYHKEKANENRSPIRRALNRQVDRALGKSGMENNVELARMRTEAAIRKARQSDKKLVLNMAGWSRGAVTAVATANVIEELKQKYPDVEIEVNLFLVDPVPGPTNTHKDKNQIIPPVVKNVTVLYANDEKRPHMRPAALRIDQQQDTNINIVRLPTDHSGLTQHLREENSAVTNVSWNFATDFLTEHGSSLDTSKMQYYDTTTSRMSVKNFEQNESNKNSYNKLEQWGKVAEKNRLHSQPGRGVFRVINHFKGLSKSVSLLSLTERNIRGIFYYKDYQALFAETCPAIYRVLTQREKNIRPENEESIQQEINNLRNNGCDTVLSQLSKIRALTPLFQIVPAERVPPSPPAHQEKSNLLKRESNNSEIKSNCLSHDKERKEVKVPGKNHFNYEIIKHLTGANHKIPSTHNKEKDAKLDKLLPVYKVISLCDYYEKMAAKALAHDPKAFKGIGHLHDIQDFKKELTKFVENLQSKIRAEEDIDVEASVQRKLQEVNQFAEDHLSSANFSPSDRKKFSAAIYEFMAAQTALYKQDNQALADNIVNPSANRAAI